MSGHAENTFTIKLKMKQRIVDAAMGKAPADLVLKNAAYVNVFTNEIAHGDIAIAEGYIVGIGTYSGLHERDCSGMTVIPGLIDAVIEKHEYCPVVATICRRS